MKYLLLFLLVIFLSFLEATFVPLNLVLLLIISLAVIKDGSEIFLIGFLAGLVFDFVKNQNLGFSSLLFLVIIFLISLYKNRFQAEKLQFLLPFTLLALIATNFVNGDILQPIKIIANTGLIVFFLPLISRQVSQGHPLLKPLANARGQGSGL